MKKWVASIWDVYGLIIETPALRNVSFCNVSMLILCDLAGDLKTSQHVREAAGDGSQKGREIGPDPPEFMGKMDAFRFHPVQVVPQPIQ